MIEPFFKHEGATRSWKAYGFCAAAAAAGGTFVVFRHAALSIFVAALVGVFAAWLDGLLKNAARQMGELAIARAHLQQGHEGAALLMSTDLAERAKLSRVRNSALTTMAWAALKKGQPERAKAALDHIRPEHQIDLYCFAAVEDALGKSKLAIEALELDAFPNRESAMFLVDLYASQGKFDRAVGTAITRRAVLGTDNCRRIIDAAVQAWALTPAAALAKALFDDTGNPADAGILLRVLAHQREFGEVDRTTDDVLRRLVSRGNIEKARSLLAELAADQTLPSGACRDFAGKLRAFDRE